MHLTGLLSVPVWEDEAVFQSRAGGLSGEAEVTAAPGGQRVCAAAGEGLAAEEEVPGVQGRHCRCAGSC